jgi:uncharacterized RDD family membrane protein YckC
MTLPPPTPPSLASPRGPFAQPPACAPATTDGDSAAYGDGSPWGPLADWGPRVGAMLLDGLVHLVGLIPCFAGFGLIIAAQPDPASYETPAGPSPDETSAGLVVAGVLLCFVGLLVMAGIQLWNRAFRQGRTGQSIGKTVVGLKLVDERTGLPIGAGMAFVRDLAHVLDGVLPIGYLWPLWDDRRQTFADKILRTVVVRLPTR